MFERLVRSTKRCLKKILFRSYLHFEEVLTVLREIQCTINNRPLTFLYEEPGDVPLTSSHLLFGRTLDSEQVTFVSEGNVKNEDLSKISLQTSRLLQHFWQRWKGEYLTELREHQRCHSNQLKGVEIKVDDAVIIEDDFKKRGLWQVGVVVEIRPSNDGRIRGAKVKYIHNGKETFVSRPINKLYPLECSYDDKTEEKKAIDVMFVNEKDVALFH